MMPADGAPGDARGTKRPAWLFWLLGLGGVIAVVGAAVKYSDAVAFAQIVHHARPGGSRSRACDLEIVCSDVVEEMQQAADARTKGLGLGLYIASEIVPAHRATISVTSTAREGTTFTIRWPRSGLPAA